MTVAPQEVLVVDDDPDTRANLCDILELDGHPVRTAGSIAEGADGVCYKPFDVPALVATLERLAAPTPR